jgi:hypothetical protein
VLDRHVRILYEFMFYIISNHCQNNKNHLISKNTAEIHNFRIAAAAASVAAAAATAVAITVD